ncbi:MAG: hypothetical protein WAS07_00270 [Micropruina sp.]
MAALSASRPGVGKTVRDVELDAANAEVARLAELAVRLTLVEGKGASDGGERPPSRCVSTPPARPDCST